MSFDNPKKAQGRESQSSAAFNINTQAARAAGGNKKLALKTQRTLKVLRNPLRLQNNQAKLHTNLAKPGQNTLSPLLTKRSNVDGKASHNLIVADAHQKEAGLTSSQPDPYTSSCMTFKTRNWSVKGSLFLQEQETQNSQSRHQQDRGLPKAIFTSDSRNRHKTQLPGASALKIHKVESN